MNLPDWFWVYLGLLPTAAVFRTALRHQRDELRIHDRIAHGWMLVWPGFTITAIFLVFQFAVMVGPVPQWAIEHDELFHLPLAAMGLGVVASQSLADGRRPLVAWLAVATLLADAALLLPGWWRLLAIPAWHAPATIGIIQGMLAHRRIWGRQHRPVNPTWRPPETGLGTGTAGAMFEQSQIGRETPSVVEPVRPDLAP